MNDDTEKECCRICESFNQKTPAIDRWWVEFELPICETHAMQVRNVQAQVKAMGLMKEKK